MSKIIGYKAFKKDFSCNPDGKHFQYQVGDTYSLANPSELRICRTGYHFCKMPFNVLNYYSSVKSRFGLIETDSSLTKSKEDKSVTSKIKIVKELSIKEFIQECLNYLKKVNKTKKTKKNVYSNRKYSIVSSTKDKVNIGSTGRRSSIVVAHSSCNIFSAGEESHITSTGESDILATGEYTKIAATDTSNIVFTGEKNICLSAGDYTKIVSENSTGVIAALGDESKVKGKIGTWFTLAEYNYKKECVHMKCFRIDGKKIKEDIFYYLKNGELAEYKTN